MSKPTAAPRRSKRPILAPPSPPETSDPAEHHVILGAYEPAFLLMEGHFVSSAIDGAEATADGAIAHVLSYWYPSRDEDYQLTLVAPGQTSRVVAVFLPHPDGLRSVLRFDGHRVSRQVYAAHPEFAATREERPR